MSVDKYFKELSFQEAEEYKANIEMVWLAYGPCFNKVVEELAAAEQKHPDWPTDNFHRAMVLAEEAGEAMKAVLDFYHDKANLDHVRKELIQTAAMALRFLHSLMEVDG